MKILWLGPNFLHPTTKGGQIRTLGMLRCLSRRHEIHYAAFDESAYPEGPARACEYSCRAYPFRHPLVAKNSMRFAAQLAAGLFSPAPISITRYKSPGLKRFLEGLLDHDRFDRVVVDFLAMSASCPDLERCVLFQHNVETVIWRRRAEHAGDPITRLYLRLQADRMFAYERAVCQAAGHIVAVSRTDAELMRSLFGVRHVSNIPTGVDLEYFAPPVSKPCTADMVFIGSMDWLPNVDGALYFVREVLPLIRRRRPGATFAIVGRTPPAAISELARKDPAIQVTGTVSDVRPYLWGSAVSVVPLRIGGGTRLKIYESMAAGVPVVSTAVGAEGLDVHPPGDIRIADRPADFAAHCLELLGDGGEHRRIAARAREMVSANFSWEKAARCFSDVLEAAPAAHAAQADAAMYDSRARV
jgi:sugar transferase (PEP-CTERM/EpsH1 system associated)